jgi:hypothetical protein
MESGDSELILFTREHKKGSLMASSLDDLNAHLSTEDTDLQAQSDALGQLQSDAQALQAFVDQLKSNSGSIDTTEAQATIDKHAASIAQNTQTIAALKSTIDAILTSPTGNASATGTDSGNTANQGSTGAPAADGSSASSATGSDATGTSAASGSSAADGSNVDPNAGKAESAAVDPDPLNNPNTPPAQ